MFWCIQDFSLLETSTAIVFLQNATKLAEQRFGTDSVTASRYSNSPICRLLRRPLPGCFHRHIRQPYLPIGILQDQRLHTHVPRKLGQNIQRNSSRIWRLCFRILLRPIDSIRTSMWHSSVFGSAYVLKITMNNAMNIIVRVITTGLIQDRDNGSYDNVTIVYIILAAGSVLVLRSS